MNGMKQRILKVLRSNGQDNREGRKLAKMWEDECMDVELVFGGQLTPQAGSFCVEMDWAGMNICLKLSTDTITIYHLGNIWREYK